MSASGRISGIAAAVVALVAGALLACSASAAIPVQTAAQVMRISYGDDPANYGMLHLPAGPGPFPVVVMVHGGGWVQAHDLSYFEPLSQSLAAEGVAVWNIEYRRVGGAGGWPTTLADAGDATDALAGVVQEAAIGRLDLDRVVVAGHSAGGHLAAWIAGRPTLPADAPGGPPAVEVNSAVVMAGVFDPALAVMNGHDRAVRNLIGGSPSQYPERYAVAAPIVHLPIGTKVIAMHGTADTTVDPVQSTSYVRAAQAFGDPAELVLVDGAGHGSFTNVDSAGWGAAKRLILNEALG